MQETQWAVVFVKLAEPGVAPSLILGVAALMALTNLRNSDIATRCRNITDEFLFKLKDIDNKHYADLRRIELRDQHDILLKRYIQLSRVFICLSSSLAVYLAAVILGQITPKEVVAVLVVLSVFLVVLAVAGLIYEFWRGPSTLKLNNQLLWRSLK